MNSVGAWHSYRGAEDADGEVLERVPKGADVDAEVRQEQSSGSSDKRVYVEVGEKVPRDFYITKKTEHLHEPNVPIVATLHGNSKEAKRLKLLEMQQGQK